VKITAGPTSPAVAAEQGQALLELLAALGGSELADQADFNPSNGGQSRAAVPDRNPSRGHEE
jgi:hypothetical protein